MISLRKLVTLLALYGSMFEALSAFTTNPPTTSTSTFLMCTLMCPPNSVENYNTCSCDCKPGYTFSYWTYRCEPLTTTTSTTRQPCTMSCRENSIADYVNCKCDCIPGYVFSYVTYRCEPQSTTVPPTTPGHTKTTQITTDMTRTTSPSCNLNCGSGFLVNNPCSCICIEFYQFNGSTCVLKPYYPRVKDCKECETMESPFNRPMRCVQNGVDKFCVP